MPAGMGYGTGMVGPGSGGGPLDGPPPSPTGMSQPPDGQFSMRGLAGPAPVPSTALPPEMLTGIVASAATIGQMLDAYAQALPDKAAQFALIKDMLQQIFAELMTAGAGAISPTASGPAPPMGGMDRGIAGAGSV